MIDIVAALFNVSSKELRRAGKTATAVSRVRQIAMYVCHVSLELTMTDIGSGFGRDRTTVMHACHLIEDMRDDAEFDGIVGLTERIAVAALRRGDAA
ncbi:helix-turn-helix domain-containing protein [Mesorhizobium xinjiangense]|uniref:helix-turn-helix domain-containing protein n=1 Tax=Mesorhizobium xinjiangense TaxID=2678685 RepID=UPI0012EED3B5|nr:helix-turn-helix domain-containing protein [Mesorhizobium xinjiangense]